jgi:hypothetical protein
MKRRQFLSGLSSSAAALASLSVPGVALAQNERPRITDIRVHRLRTLGETGIMESAWAPGRPYMRRIGGGSFTEILTDQGITGIAPGMNPAGINRMKQLLVGQDPFDNETLGHQMRYTNGAASNWRDVGCIEIALWDIVGKVTGQPLYKLWGAQKDKVPAYASMIQLSTPEERAETAAKLKTQGWQGVKIRLHHLDMKEDIRTIELVRDAVGDDFTIMTDANQAQSSGIWQPGVQWDFTRALDTARALKDMNVYWLEEPLRRYDFDGLSELNRMVDIPLAGGIPVDYRTWRLRHSATRDSGDRGSTRPARCCRTGSGEPQAGYSTSRRRSARHNSSTAYDRYLAALPLDRDYERPTYLTLYEWFRRHGECTNGRSRGVHGDAKRAWPRCRD